MLHSQNFNPTAPLSEVAPSGRGESDVLFESGRVVTGANYWASHAGIFMWRDWRPEVVEADFARLASIGLTALRVFPLWPDFQPVTRLFRQKGLPGDYRHGERSLGDEEVGEDGVSIEMLRRLRTLADLAEKHGLRLIVAIVTGWMSGRLFVPPALEGRNPITDAISLQWQLRLAKAVVGTLRGHPAMMAWDLGNECNCLGEATQEEAWVWTAALASAIRAADPALPVVSGMHSLAADPKQAWAIRDQGELTDVLTTHPYSLFTPYCDQEPLDTMRPLLHAAAETVLYADLSGRPAFVEEFGTLGPMVCGDEVAAAMAKVRIVDAWTHDARAVFWWCAFDQSHLEYAPYDWRPLERELGLLTQNGEEKPVAKRFREMAVALGGLPKLSARRVEALCILLDGQDQWGVAYSAFVLAKQAGFDIRFHYSDRSLPQAELYLLPSVNGITPLSKRIEEDLWRRVEEGATLYLSLDDTMLGSYSAKTGVQFGSRYRRSENSAFRFEGKEFPFEASVAYQLHLPSTAEILAVESNGRPFFFATPCGKGKVYSLLAPLEGRLARQPGAFNPLTSLAYWRVYATVATEHLRQRWVQKTSPWLGVTEHPTGDEEGIVVLVNYSGALVNESIRIRPGFKLGCILYGPTPAVEGEKVLLTIPAAEAAVWRVSRESQASD